MKGDLAQTGLMEVLRQLGNKGQSGLLVLQRTKGWKEVRFWVRDGAIVLVEPKKRPEERRLGQLLVRGGAIEGSALKYALVEQKSSGAPIGQILVESKVLTQDELQHFLDLQGREDIWSVLFRAQGTYVFEAQHVGPEIEQMAPLPGNSKLLEEMNNRQRWNSILEVRGGMDAVYATRRGPASSEPIELSDVSRRLLDLVDGKKTVAELIALTRVGEYLASGAMAELVNRGLLFRIQTTDTSVPKARSKWGVRGFVAVINIFAIVGLSWVVQKLPNRAELGARRLETLPSVLEQRLELNQSQLLRDALELYRIEKGQYPDELKSLLEAGGLSEQSSRVVGDSPIDYVGIGSDYDLRIGK